MRLRKIYVTRSWQSKVEAICLCDCLLSIVCVGMFNHNPQLMTFYWQFLDTKNNRLSNAVIIHYIKVFLIAGKNFQSILLVGNKLDMVLSRTVSTDRAFKVAAMDKKIWFLETSAFLKFNVHNVFCTILQREMEKQWVRSFSDPDFSCQRRQQHIYRTISDTLCTPRVACKSAYLLTK